MKKIISLTLCMALLFSLAARCFAEDFSVMEESCSEPPTTSVNIPEGSPEWLILNNMSFTFYIANSKAYVSYFVASNHRGIDVTVKLYKGLFSIFSFASDEQSTDKKYISGVFNAPVDGFAKYRVEITVNAGGEKIKKEKYFTYDDNLFVGDVSGDGKINTYDARMILRYSAKLQKLSRAQLELADIDRNSVVNVSDARCALIMASRM